MLKPRLLSALVLLAAVVGCTSIESDKLETSEMRASITVSVAADGDSVDVAAVVGNGALSFVDFDGDDVLGASSGETSIDLVENNAVGVFAYRGTLEGVGPGEIVKVSLTRGEGKTSAPDSTVTVPVPVTITSPPAATSFSRAEAIIIELGGAVDDDADTLGVQWSGSCVDTGSFDVPIAQRSITIAADTIKPLPQPEDADAEPVATSCELQVTVNRRTNGSLDKAWGSGNIVGEASAARKFTTTP